jgi:hypothetical protein
MFSKGSYSLQFTGMVQRKTRPTENLLTTSWITRQAESVTEQAIEFNGIFLKGFLTILDADLFDEAVKSCATGVYIILTLHRS